MNRGIYSTATGMLAAQRWMDVTANNLANVSTPGFKQDGLTFNDFLVRDLVASGGRGPIIGSMGSGASPQGGFTNFEVGSIEKTNNPLDLALTGSGEMFAVQTPAGVRYTRDGQFSLDVNGRVIDRNGRPLLDDNQREIVVDGNGPITVSRSGEISQNERPIAQIGVYQGNFTKVGDNDFQSANAVLTPTSDIQQGALEQSNAQPIQAMVDMIRFGRFYEMSQKSIQTQDEMTGKVLEVLRD